MEKLGEISTKTELILKALAGNAIEAQCVVCNALEWVIAMDNAELDGNFLANYHCDICEANA